MASRGAKIFINENTMQSRLDGHDEVDLLLIVPTHGASDLIGRTTLDSSRVHDCGDRHRMVDQNLHQEASEGSPADAWMEMERSIVIKSAIAIGRAISIRWPRFSPIFISPWQCVEFPGASVFIRRAPQVEPS